MVLEFCLAYGSDRLMSCLWVILGGVLGIISATDIWAAHERKESPGHAGWTCLFYLGVRDLCSGVFCHLKSVYFQRSDEGIAI